MWFRTKPSATVALLRFDYRPRRTRMRVCGAPTPRRYSLNPSWRCPAITYQLNGAWKCHIPTHDTRGRSLPHWEDSRVLADDEIFVYSAQIPNSCDSRFFGPVRAHQIFGTYRKLFSFENAVANNRSRHTVHRARCIPPFASHQPATGPHQQAGLIEQDKRLCHTRLQLFEFD